MAEELKEKTAKGLFWGGLNNGLLQLLSLVFGIVLARILSDAEYGMVGMLVIFSSIASTMQESGFISALANRKEVRHDDYNAVFWFGVVVSVSLYLILFFSAPLIADFYDEPKLTSLARYTFIAFLFSGFSNAQNAYLFRHLMVRQRTISMVIGNVLSGTVGIVMALNGMSYWGIATQGILYVATTNIGYWFFSPWRPTLRVNFTPIKEMLPFSIKLVITNIFSQVNANIFSVILGRAYSAKEVGIYTQSNKWNNMGNSIISGMIYGVAQPALASVEGDTERQLRILRKLMRFTVLIAFPLMLGFSLTCSELIPIAIGDKWLDCVPILRVLCVGGAFFPIANLFFYLIISKGKSDVYMWNVIILGAIQIVILLLLCPYGMYWMSVVYCSVNIAWLGVLQHFAYKKMGYTFLSFMRDICPTLIVTLVVMGFTFFLTQGIANPYLLLMGKILVAVALYIPAIYMVQPEMVKESIRFIQGKKRK